MFTLYLVLVGGIAIGVIGATCVDWHHFRKLSKSRRDFYKAQADNVFREGYERGVADQIKACLLEDELLRAAQDRLNAATPVIEPE